MYRPIARTLMSLLFFPLQTRRTDAHRGLLARQIARAVQEGLGCPGETARWIVRRGPHVAHVLIETPLPNDVVQTECSDRGADLAVHGSLFIDEPTVEVRWTLTDASGARTVSVTADGVLHAIDASGRALAAALDTEWSAAHLPPAVAAVDWLADRDNEELVDAAGPSAVQPAAAAYEGLLNVARVAPEFTPALTTLRARRTTWAATGASVALELAAALAAVTRNDADYDAWAGLAEATEDADQEERALSAWSRTTAQPARVRVRLGKLLIRLRRSREALPLLEEARDDAEFQDAALTYLGVAFAEVGEIGRAVELWRQVADEGNDQGFVRLAREHLQRATSLQGMS